MVSEALQQHGYATGGIVANINLAPSFGFQQGYDEYHYLSPDYLFGSKESSSKLIFYQIGRKVALQAEARSPRDGLLPGRDDGDARRRRLARAPRGFALLPAAALHGPARSVLPASRTPARAIARVEAEQSRSVARGAHARALRRRDPLHRRTHRNGRGEAARTRHLGRHDDRDHRRPRRGVPRARRLVARHDALRRADPRPAAGEVAEGQGRRAGARRPIIRCGTSTSRRRCSRWPVRRFPPACRGRISRCRWRGAASPSACTTPRRITRATCCVRSEPTPGS